MGVLSVPQTGCDPRRGKRVAGRFGPLDEADRVIEVRLEVAPFRCRESLKAIEVEMGNVGRAGVAVPDRVRGARHRHSDPERTAGPADERGLARPELSGDGDDVAGGKLVRDE